jgi:hypothetical protein
MKKLFLDLHTRQNFSLAFKIFDFGRETDKRHDMNHTRRKQRDGMHHVAHACV